MATVIDLKQAVGLQISQQEPDIATWEFQRRSHRGHRGACEPVLAGSGPRDSVEDVVELGVEVCAAAHAASPWGVCLHPA